MALAEKTEGAADASAAIADPLIRDKAQAATDKLASLGAKAAATP
jgi:hypothetical protein